MALIASIAFAFYAPSLRFGFFNDDPTGHLRWMAGRSIWSLLTDASGHGYYRPFSFILWQVFHLLLGRHDPFTLHLLNVLAHAMNAALVAWLAHRLTGQWVYASLAGLLFALYPFSYEAVPYVGSFVHPLATLLILLTLALYLEWRASNSHWAFAAAHITLTLGVFTQENVVITPLLILGLDALISKLKRRADGVMASLSFFAEPIVFAVVWLLVPKLPEARTLSLEAMRANVLPFVQALVYPVAPLANHNAATLALLALLCLAALSVLAWRAQALGLLAFALLMWALASLPSILILDNNYVLGSPRLFYLASVGAALVCALPTLLKPASRRLKFGIWILTFIICYLPSASYVRCQLSYQGMAGEIGRMMANAAQSASPGQEVTFINLPYFFSSRGPGTECRNPFVYAPTGAVVIPPYAEARDFVIYNGGPDRPALALTVREYQPGWQTFGGPASVDQLRQRLGTSHVYVFDLVRWQLMDLSTAWQPAAPSRPALFTLKGVQISSLKSQISNDKLMVSLTWQAEGPAQNLKVFAHVCDASGNTVAQDDGLPADGLVPAPWWQPGDVITDTRTITLAGLLPGTYRVTAGLYDPVTGTRLEARDTSGARLPGDEIPVTQITR
jgi:hypothetical protein